MSELNSSLPAWAAVAAHAKEMVKVHLRDLAGTDAKRWQQCHVEHDTWLLDISRQRITQQSLSLLLDLARAVGLSDRIVAMFRGDPINTTEKRAVLHTALRSDFAGSPAIQAEVKASRQKLENYVAAVRSGRKLGITGKKFRHVVNIGIGGSDLGPLLVCDALRAEWSGDITPHFVSNVDRTQLEDLTRTLDPAETLVIVCSKTFVTQETQTNANAARAWIVGALGEKAPGNHFVAVSTNAEAMDKFGIAPDHRFTMWDWVGGRYSVWSAIGLIAEIVIGSERFEEFLQGASDIDKHFTTAPFEKNLPVLMGVLGVWNRTFLNLPTLAVLPYDQRLARLPAYLQQLEMESNGKSVSLEGLHVNFATAPIVWGEPGSNAQHSFFQMLHQGTLTQALDFIAPLRGSWGGTEGQDLALKNCFAQSQAFAYGYTLPEVEADMRKAGVAAAEIDRIAIHRVHEGNRPSSLLMYPQTTARSLGGILALYEHSVFVQGTIWGINSFDQFGVELGKKLAVGIDMTGAKAPQGTGAAGIAALINYVATHR
ncbi:MAG TPA: glucose-6-phosphate isomerase [Steroidobacteraceae bacterium]|jgi:glucose-6-phosphate isomerase|nr:glucose-6-phosphate isomerase [Steroidobacteraceae bacterium]